MVVIWDQTKAKINLKKHGISFEEAQTVLESDQQLILEDQNHDEERFIALGLSKIIEFASRSLLLPPKRCRQNYFC